MWLTKNKAITFVKIALIELSEIIRVIHNHFSENKFNRMR